MLNVVVRTCLASLLVASAVSATELAPGVVVDAERATVYVMAPGGGFDCLDVVTGQPVWSTKRAARPLLSLSGRVLAQAEESELARLHVVGLDTVRGGLAGEAALRLPGGAEARIEDRPGSLFRIEAEPSGPRVRVRWSSERRPVKGTLEGDDDGDAEGSVRREGNALVDLQPMAIAVEDEKAVPTALVPLPAVLAREADAGAFRERPQRMGAFFVATQDVARDGGSVLLLRRFDAQGAPLPELALPEGVTLQLASDEGRYALVSRRIPGAALEQSHEWIVLALDTGAQVAVLRTDLAAARFAVARGRVLYTEPPGKRREARGFVQWPLTLHAFDAASGVPAWSRPVRDTAFRGQQAP